jgi:ubiquitin C-terminal hydrolase
MTDMVPYDAKLVPSPFGLNNTGVICYLNAFLQLLTSCSTLTRAIFANEDYLRSTLTGTALLKYFSMFATAAGARAAPDANMAFGSADVLAALRADLAARRPKARFGGGQESADEVLVHLLEMIEPPGSTVENPIMQLFCHRYQCDTVCGSCKGVVSVKTDYSIDFKMFQLLRNKTATNTTEFSAALGSHAQKVEDYLCEKCGEKGKAYRIYTLTMIPEIIICVFGIYYQKKLNFFPEHVEFPLKGSKGTRVMQFRAVAQVEHSGSRDSGHYWARALRGDGVVHHFNDMGVKQTSLCPTEGTYVVAYHYAGVVEAKKADTPKTWAQVAK